MQRIRTQRRLQNETRKEAIKILTETQVVYFAPNGKEKVQEALDMAIEALKAKTEGDTISRQDAIETVKELNRIVNEDRYGTVCTLDVLSRIGKLPSAEAVDVNEVTIHYKPYPSAEAKTESVLCALADRACPFQGKEYVWCLTCPHISEEDRALVKRAVPQAEAEDRHYIKIYADDEPSVKAEKLYQICGETQNREVAEWLKEYFQSINDNWIPCSARLPEDSGDYLVRPSDGVLEDYSDFSEVMIMPYDADCEAFGWWVERYDPISLGYLDSDFDEFEVVAWMPFPKPYREDDDA